MKDTARWITKAGALAVAFFAMAACSDAPTAPVPATVRAAAPTPLIACEEENMDYCDGGGSGGGGGGSGQTTYLQYFLASTCDLYGYGSPTCSPNCTSYDGSCILYQTYGAYHELRQTLYEANGTGIQYNSQKWHSLSGLDVPIFTQSLCGAPGRYINVEIYQLSWGDVDRRVSFRVEASDNGQYVVAHSPTTPNWVATVKYSWTC